MPGTRRLLEVTLGFFFYVQNQKPLCLKVSGRFPIDRRSLTWDDMSRQPT